MEQRHQPPWPQVTAALPDLVITRTDARHVAQVFSSLAAEQRITPGSVVKVICRPNRWAPDFSHAFADFVDTLPPVMFEVDADPQIRDEVVHRLYEAIRSHRPDPLYMHRAPLGFAS